MGGAFESLRPSDGPPSRGPPSPMPTSSIDDFGAYDLGAYRDPKPCQMPLKNNPYGNMLITDISDRPGRPEACDPELTKDESDDIFYENLYRDTTDLYEQANSKRQYYTMPNTKIANDQTAFAKLCFGNSGKLKSLGQRYYSP